MGFWGSVLLLLAGAVASSALLERYDPSKISTCSQGLISCSVEEVWPLVPEEDSGPVEISDVDVKPVLCCKENQRCKVCLLITIHLHILNKTEGSGEDLGDGEDEDEGSITVRIYSGPNHPRYRRISFTVKPAARGRNAKAQLKVVEYRDVFPGSRVNVTVSSFDLSVSFPSLSEVCPYADLEECKSPRVIPVIDWSGGVAELRAVDEDVSHPERLQICVKRGLKGSCWKSPSSIPLHSVTSCMCFEAWTNGSRTAHCPFTTNKVFRQNAVRNASLAVSHAEGNDGRPVLSWNLSAPCRLEAEVWPCRMGAGGGCEEVPGFRVHRDKNSKWCENSTTLWTSGSFVNFSSHRHFLYCVKFKVDGVISDPVCQHNTRRWRWSVPVLVALMLFGLVGVGVCLLRRRIRGYVSDWEKTHHSGVEAGGEEVLLLSAGGSDPGCVCVLADQLCCLGLGVCSDLGSQREVGSCGPGPWLHSKLDQLQKHRGKALLVLSDPAQACWDSWTRDRMGPEDNRTPPCSSDVFGYALSCVYSAQLKGGAAERFALVQFDSQRLIDGDRLMPELFRGLELYNLPSESRRLLAELCPERTGRVSMRLKRLLWLRQASAKLEKGLRNCGKGLRPHADSVLTQEESLEEEMLPLKH